MEFRTADEEQFEDNPEEYIRRDLEGSGKYLIKAITLKASCSKFNLNFLIPDVDTRRRAACDLVKGLTRYFEGPVTGIFSQYVATMLQVRLLVL